MTIFSRRSVRSTLAGLLLVTTGVGLAGAYEDQVRAALDNVYSRMPSGYVRVNELRDIDILADGRSVNITYTLSGGNYAFVGVCDEDCNDLDLELRDQSGRLVDYDDENDDTPIVQVNAARGSKYTLKVIMSDCTSTDDCVYGVDAFRK